MNAEELNHMVISGEAAVEKVARELTCLRRLRSEFLYGAEAQKMVETTEGVAEFEKIKKGFDVKISAQSSLLAEVKNDLIMWLNAYNEYGEKESWKAKIEAEKADGAYGSDCPEKIFPLPTDDKGQPDSGNLNRPVISERDLKSKVPANLPRYGGKGGVTSPTLFIEKLEAACEASEFPKSRWARVLPSLMELRAHILLCRKWIDCSWTEARKKFLDSQLSTEHIELRRDELDAIQKVKHETVKEYIERFEELLNDVPLLTDKDMQEKLLSGLVASDLDFKRQLDRSIMLLKTAGADMDFAMVKSLALKMAAREERDQLKKKKTDAGFTGTCNWCGTKGHKERDCLSKKAGKSKNGSGMTVVSIKQEGKPAEHHNDKRTFLKGSGYEAKKGRCHTCGEEGHFKYQCPQAKGKIRQVSNESLEEAGLVCQVDVSDEQDNAVNWFEELMLSDHEEVVVRRVGSGMCIRAPCIFGGQRVMALVDSGSTTSLVDKNWALECGLDVQQGGGLLTGAFAGQKQERYGTVLGVLQCGGTQEEVRFGVAELSSDRMIIGMDLFPILGIRVEGVPVAWSDQLPSMEPSPVEEDESAELNLRCEGVDEILPEERVQVLAAWGPLIEENQRIPEDAFCTYPGAVLPVDTGDAKPVFVPQYKVPRHLHDQVTARVEEWLSKGWTREAPKGNPWNFPLTAAPKKDGQGGMTAMRLCIDLRELNKLIQDDSYPIPRIQEVIEENGGNLYFGSFDLADSYHQWRIREGDEVKVAFTWNGVQYCFVRACFGIKTMTAAFQRVMNEILRSVPRVRAYVDDTFFGRRELADFISTGTKILELLNRYQCRLRIKKCVFVASKLVHLGRLLARDGIRPDPAKVELVLNWPVPLTYKSLKSFNCLCGYYRDSIPGFASIVAPLTEVQERKGAISEWTSDMDAAFQTVKAKFAGDLVLAYPDLSLPMHLHVDASLVGMGAVLSQIVQGVERPIFAISRAFRGAENRYSATKKELYALIWSLLKLEQLLRAGKFILYTDHRALTFLLTQRHLNPMLERWVDVVLRFNFEVVHVAGKDNVVADALSRQYESWGRSRKNRVYPHMPDVVSVVLSDAILSSQVGGEQVGQEQLGHHEELALLRGKMLVPEEERQQLIKDVHEMGHFGEDRVFAFIWDNGKWWPSMRADVQQAISRCHRCLQHNVVRKGYHPMRAVDTVYPWDMICIDLKKLPKAKTGEEQCLIIVDVFSRYVLLRALPDKKMETLASILWQMFADFGVPKSIQSDQGTEFVNECVTTLRRLFGTHHRLVAAYSHQANGLVERMARTVGEVLRKKLSGHHDVWPLWLPLVQMSLNAVNNATTGTPPYTLLFGRVATPLASYGEQTDVPIPSAEDVDAFVEQQKWVIDKVYPLVVEKGKQAKKKSHDYQKKKRKVVKPLAIGVQVYALDPRRESKWDAVYEGPYEVVGMDEKDCYVLRDADGILLGRHFSMDQLKVMKQGEGELERAYVVEFILNHRQGQDGMEYFVKWKNYSEEWNEWIPESNFNDTKVITDYWKKIRADSAGVLGTKKVGTKKRSAS